jgi:hypothetical protein
VLAVQGFLHNSLGGYRFLFHSKYCNAARGRLSPARNFHFFPPKFHRIPLTYKANRADTERVMQD